MVLILVIGDLHIPLRASTIPIRFQKLLNAPGKIQQILSIGNLCDKQTYEYLRSICSDVRGVRGDYDENPALPPSLVLQHGPLRIGVLHGHQLVPLGDTEALSAVARKMDVDVLISGGTHRFETFEYDGRFFINPGSATGAFSPFWTPAPLPPSTEAPVEAVSEMAITEKDKAIKEETQKVEETMTSKPSATSSTYPPSPTPSFALLDVQGMSVVTYVYQLVEGEVRVEKLSFKSPRVV